MSLKGKKDGKPKESRKKFSIESGYTSKGYTDPYYDSPKFQANETLDIQEMHIHSWIKTQKRKYSSIGPPFSEEKFKRDGKNHLKSLQKLKTKLPKSSLSRIEELEKLVKRELRSYGGV